LSSPWQLDDSELAFAMSGIQTMQQRESAVALG
jgi:flagellar biosynthesis protein FlhF